MCMKKHVYLELLDADFVFVICPHDKIKETLKGMLKADRMAEFEEKLSQSKISAQVRGKQIPMSGGGSVVWLKKMDKPTLLHECVHAANFLLMDRGIPHTEDTEEIYAYLITWLYNKAI